MQSLRRFGAVLEFELEAVVELDDDVEAEDVFVGGLGASESESVSSLRSE